MAETKKSAAGKYIGATGVEGFDHDHKHPNKCCMSPWHIRPNKNKGGHSWEWHGWMRNGELVSV